MDKSETPMNPKPDQETIEGISLEGHIKTVFETANTQTCLNSDLRESMRVVARLAAKQLEIGDGSGVPDQPVLSCDSFASRLRALRQSKHLTQLQLAELCGWSQSRLGHYENAKREPSFADINAIAKALEVTSTFLLFGN